SLEEIDDELTVMIVDARQAVRFTREDGVEARADELLADQTARTATLVGNARVGRGPTTISGGNLKLFDEDRRIEVFGAGRFEHMADDRLVIDATWDIDMSYSDVTGMLDASGNVIATHTPRDGWKDTLQAHRIHAEIESIEESDAIVAVTDDTTAAGDDGTRVAEVTSEPADGPADDATAPTEIATATEADEPDAQPGLELTELGANRRVTAMHATGLVMDLEDGVPASFESTRYEDGTLVRAFRLIGPEIDATESEIRMDHPGRLFVADLRHGDDTQDLGDRRGTALFDWKKDLVIDRVDGVMHMRRQVRMIHNASDGGEDTLLDCEELTAFFTETDEGGELRQVDAKGAVYLATRKDKELRSELVADALRYDAVGRTSTALAHEGRVVTLFDAERGAPFSAEALFWDLNTDRVEIRDPELVSVPR
ncbi:MAG: hypothetical protein KDA28_04675, partial [Phycisphaerales bacterium]|nr:hypothetical protein [Phycisphaerales bacterium]